MATTAERVVVELTADVASFNRALETAAKAAEEHERRISAAARRAADVQTTEAEKGAVGIERAEQRNVKAVESSARRLSQKTESFARSTLTAGVSESPSTTSGLSGGVGRVVLAGGAGADTSLKTPTKAKNWIGLVVEAGVEVIDATVKVRDLYEVLRDQTGSKQEATEAMAFTEHTAQKHSLNVFDVGESFARLLSVRNSGQISDDQAKQILEGLAEVTNDGGGSAADLRLSVSHLATALESGTPNAPTLDQVATLSPRLYPALDRAFVSLTDSSDAVDGAFRRAADGGKLTSELLERVLLLALKEFQGASERTVGNTAWNFDAVLQNFGALSRRLSNWKDLRLGQVGNKFLPMRPRDELEALYGEVPRLQEISTHTLFDPSIAAIAAEQLRAALRQIDELEAQLGIRRSNTNAPSAVRPRASLRSTPEPPTQPTLEETEEHIRALLQEKELLEARRVASELLDSTPEPPPPPIDSVPTTPALKATVPPTPAPLAGFLPPGIFQDQPALFELPVEPIGTGAAASAPGESAPIGGLAPSLLADQAAYNALLDQGRGLTAGYSAALEALIVQQAQHDEQLKVGILTKEQHAKAEAENAARQKELGSAITAVGDVFVNGIKGAADFNDALDAIGLGLLDLAIKGLFGQGALGGVFNQLLGNESGAAGILGALIAPVTTSTGGGTGGGGGGLGSFLGSVLSGLFGGGLAAGGQALPGKLYQVGEAGREWFAPSVPGQVIPNSVIKNAAGGGGGSSQPIQFNISMAGANGDRAIYDIAARAVKTGLAGVPEINRQHEIRFA